MGIGLIDGSRIYLLFTDFKMMMLLLYSRVHSSYKDDYHLPRHDNL